MLTLLSTEYPIPETGRVMIQAEKTQATVGHRGLGACMALRRF
jgi:hypothetical protein